MYEIVILPSFERSAKKLSLRERNLLAESLDKFNVFLQTQEAPFGFRFKKINQDKYEFRVDLRLRVIVKKGNNIFYLVLVGNHDRIRRYLRNFR